MKAVRLHEYDKRPVVEDVPEPRVDGPFDVVVEIGGAGLCRTDLHMGRGVRGRAHHPSGRHARGILVPERS